jgi:hypothetical protein
MTQSLSQAMDDLRKTTLNEFHEVKSLLAAKYDKIETLDTATGEDLGKIKQEAEQASRETLNQETVSGTTGNHHFGSAYSQAAPFDIARSCWGRLTMAEVSAIRHGFPINTGAPKDLIEGFIELEKMHFGRKSTRYKIRIGALLGN